MVQAAIIGLALQGKAQTGADIGITLDVPASVSEGQSFVTTATITNSDPLTTAVTSGVSTKDVSRVLYGDVIPLGCTRCFNCSFVGYDCSVVLGPNGTVTLLLPWRAQESGTVEWRAFASGSLPDPSSANNFDTQTMEITPAPFAVTATVTPGANQPGDRVVNLGSTDIPVLHINAGAGAETISMQSMTFMLTGTLNPGQVELNIFADTDSSGQVGSNDGLLGSGTPAAMGADFSITITGGTDIPPNSTHAFLVTANLRPNSTTRTAAAQTVPLWPILLGIPLLAGAVCVRRCRRLFVVVLLIGGVLWLTTGCPSDDAEDEEEAQTLSVTLVNVAAVAPNTGAPVIINGLPVTGATITIQP
jgi:hypothetical protein